MNYTDVPTLENVLAELRSADRDSHHTKFWGVEPFKLLENANIIPVKLAIMVETINSYADQSYFVNEDMMLEPIAGIEVHLGFEGVHKPEDILDIRVARNGWSMYRMFYTDMIENLENYLLKKYFKHFEEVV